MHKVGLGPPRSRTGLFCAQGNEKGRAPCQSQARQGGCHDLQAHDSPSPRRSPGRHLWKVISNNGLFQCPDSNPSVQLADIANSNSAAFSCCHNKLRAALMGGLGQEEGGIPGSGRAWVARKGSPFLSSISYRKIHPTTSPFPDPDPHSPPSPRAFIDCHYMSSFLSH